MIHYIIYGDNNSKYNVIANSIDEAYDWLLDNVSVYDINNYSYRIERVSYT